MVHRPIQLLHTILQATTRLLMRAQVMVVLLMALHQKVGKLKEQQPPEIYFKFSGTTLLVNFLANNI